MQQYTPVLFLIALISLFTLVEFSVPVPYDVHTYLSKSSERNLHNGRLIPNLYTDTGTMDAPCEAHDGQNITHGELYIPGPNMCSFCVCYHGSPMWCQLIFCPGPPWKTCEKWEIGTACCEFKCEVPRVNAALRSTGFLDSVLSLVVVLVFLLL